MKSRGVVADRDTVDVDAVLSALSDRGAPPDALLFEHWNPGQMVHGVDWDAVESSDEPGEGTYE